MPRRLTRVSLVRGDRALEWIAAAYNCYKTKWSTCVGTDASKSGLA